jgi:uncharacterized protein involved in response to NO
MAVSRVKAYRGPALFSYGFRPFFLCGALYAAVAIIGWMGLYTGHGSLPTGFAPLAWHTHEMIYGWLAAIITGFLLTAVPNWTGGLPLAGAPLAGLLSLWLTGRIAVAFSAWLGWPLAAMLDCLFLAAVVAAILREIVAGKNWQNLKIVVIVSLLLAGNIAFHLETWLSGAAAYSQRAGIACVVALLMLIGGRIVPSFTRNWLARRQSPSLPSPFGRFDLVALAASFVALAIWVAVPDHPAAGVTLLLAGLLQLARLCRWAGYRTVEDRLVLVLHAGYAFIPLGFGLQAAAAFGIAPASAGVHAWMAGAAGTMTLAVMTRATLGHTGRALEADRATQAIYAAIVLAAMLRIAAALLPDLAWALVIAAACGWCFAQLGFVLVYGRYLLAPRLQ